MIEVSEKAKSFLNDLLAQRPEPNHIFRLSRQAGGFSVSFENAADGDLLFKHDETTVLAIATDLADELDGTIDRQDSSEGPKLVIVRQ